jgi:PAS domain S-box-containing protein
MSVFYIILFLTIPIGIFLFFIQREKKHTKQYATLQDFVKKQSYEIENYKATLKQRDAELKHYELLALITEQTESGIMLMDPDGNITWANQAFERMYEYSFEEFTNALGNNIRKTSFNPKITDRLNRCQIKHECVIYEALNITKSGSKIWTHTSLIPLIRNGKLKGMATVDSDIHRRVVNTEHLISLMEQINSQIDNLDVQFQVLLSETNDLFQTISKSKQVIAQTDEIINYIKDVSDKTRILGINASIEASIAGNAGRGFRVIANEIVQISNNTINSVKEISDLIDNLKTGYQQLRQDRKDSQSAFNNYRKLMELLKTEVVQIENRLEEFKALQ